MATITRLKWVDPERVYDLSVEDSGHTWIGNGVVVGNTGKTAITIAALENQFDEESILTPGLWVTLGTLMQQTKAAIEQFTEGSSTVMVIPAGSDAPFEKRQEHYDRARAWETDYVILSYEAVKFDWEEVVTLPKGFMVVDEVSFIRGFNAERSLAVKELSQGVPVRYGLTGTPIENGKPEEFYSLFEFIDPTLFGRWDIFDRTFIERNGNGYVTKYVNLPTFHKRLERSMVRLKASDPEVAPFMPKKHDGEPILVPLDVASQRLYDRIAADLLTELEVASLWGKSFNLGATYGRSTSGDTKADRARGKIGQRLQALLMLCDHPELLRLSAKRYVNAAAKGKAGGNAYIYELGMEGLLTPASTPKLDRLESWVNYRLKDPDTKIVVFTRWVPMIKLIGARFPKDLWTPYSGTQTAKGKDASLTRFQRDPDCRILVSSDAGGFGLDIPQANYLMNYDLPDGAGAADQRDTRIDRTSSTFEYISRNWMFIEGSVEERNWAQLNKKRAVAAAFVDRKGLNAKGGFDLNTKTLTKFLRESGINVP